MSQLTLHFIAFNMLLIKLCIYNNGFLILSQAFLNLFSFVTKLVVKELNLRGLPGASYAIISIEKH